MVSSHEHEKFVLSVLAGPSYDESTHVPISVNTGKATSFSSDHVSSASVKVRVKNYRGLPENSPGTSAYFETEGHRADLYSIEFKFRLRENYGNEDANASTATKAASSTNAPAAAAAESSTATDTNATTKDSTSTSTTSTTTTTTSSTPKTKGIPGPDLVFGNDFDRPIRDRLPPGFNTAFKFVKWMVDPGLEGEPYADEPWLYGPLLSSVNVLSVGEKTADEEPKKEEHVDSDDEKKVLEEGATSDEAWEARKHGGTDVPSDAAARKKYFLDAEKKKEWTFEAGREYRCDFFNPYLDFNEFAVKLPVITLPILKYLSGKSLSHHVLRYVLKDRRNGNTLLVVVFKLVPTDKLDEPANVSTTPSSQSENGSIRSLKKKLKRGSRSSAGSAGSSASGNDDVD